METSTKRVRQVQGCDRCAIVIDTYTEVLIRGRYELYEVRNFTLNSCHYLYFSFFCIAASSLEANVQQLWKRDSSVLLIQIPF
jgi:hypothetical protein